MIEKSIAMLVDDKEAIERYSFDEESEIGSVETVACWSEQIDVALIVSYWSTANSADICGKIKLNDNI